MNIKKKKKKKKKREREREREKRKEKKRKKKMSSFLNLFLATERSSLASEPPKSGTLLTISLRKSKTL